MNKITLSDVKNLQDYELIRDDWKRDVIAAKARRRVALGEWISLVFENRLTVLHQVQEMCRAERIVNPAAVQQELDVYNELLPGPGEVAATLLVEITDVDRVKDELDKLLGLTSGEHLWLEIAGRRVFARFLDGQSREDRIAAVQYLRFPVGTDPAARAALESGPLPVVLHLAHPHIRASSLLSPEARRELARDLAPDVSN
ncbi:MAG: DUF3501 family protein [Acidobacteria bacterium]|nr:DUF3501 family protein [Acidobacteriota bacterium]